MSDYKVTIGIEIHAEINTKTKMFTNSKNSFFDKVNTNINEYDVALPGSLPIVNMNVVDNAISLAYALNMQIDHILKFDRKPYRHYDLPKGFQITQFFHPIATNGFVETKTKKIGIEEFHIEEDTAKAIIENDIVKLDYNRSGVPLIEIVSKPEIYSAFEAVEYLKEIKAILTFLNICDGKLENGSMRADVNISIDKEEYCKGQRVEIKNLNSFNNVEKAIEFEISRQKELLENNQEVLFETRMWNEKINQTIAMRKKQLYNYLPEPNITPINISNRLENIKQKMPKLPKQIKEELKNSNVSENYIDILIADYSIFKVFDKISKATNNPTLTSSWVIVELLGKIKKDNIKIEDISEKDVTNLIEIILLLTQNKISTKQAKDLFEESYKSKTSPNELAKNLKPVISDENILTNIINNIITNNENVKKMLAERPERAIGGIVGLVMKETNGCADPKITNMLIAKLIKR